MIQQFVNREKELKFLEEKFSEDFPQLIVLYGRRRVGKTQIIKQFLKGKRGIYVLCSRESLSENLAELKRKFYELTGKEYFLKLNTTSFFEIFKIFADEIKNEKVVVAIDEFPYLIELDKGIVSVFQKIWDEVLINTKVFLIICGSNIGMMETEILSYKSPLYGRRTGQWKVEPFEFKSIGKLFRKLSFEELVKVWSVFGNIPYYLSFFDENFSVEENIKRKILKKGQVLFQEPMILLREEFREPRVYTLILKYISLGYNSLGEISSATGMDKGNVSKYLSVLEETQIIEHVLPFGQRKRGIYILKDPFFNFWFKFVYPNISDLEIGLIDEVASRIFKELNAYYGIMFERLVLELVKSRAINFPISFDWVGKWWHKDKEIDLLALNSNTNQIVFCECKWQENVDARKVLNELRNKAKFVRWRNEERMEYYAIFAKSFKERVEDRNVFLFDLKDLENSLKN